MGGSSGDQHMRRALVLLFLMTTVSPALAGDCTVTFRLSDSIDNVGSLHWDTDYSDAPGGFVGKGGNVECQLLLTNTPHEFTDVDNEESLISAVISLYGF